MKTKTRDLRLWDLKEDEWVTVFDVTDSDIDCLIEQVRGENEQKRDYAKSKRKLQ